MGASECEPPGIAALIPGLGGADCEISFLEAAANAKKKLGTQTARVGSQPSGSKSESTTDPPKIITTQELFDGQREIYIEHDGEQYRLRITRRNKLILQK